MKTFSRILVLLASVVALSAGASTDKLKMNFTNEELGKIIEMYSRASGQKFVIDPAVRGKVSILIQEPVTLDEAFNQLSSALALNGFAISKQGDTMVVMTARNIQRSLTEVSSEMPSLKPERMYTWIYTFKNVAASDVNRDLRILASKDGEMSILEKTNQIIMTDWVSNLNRVGNLLAQLDRPAEPSAGKIAETAKKAREAQRKTDDDKRLKLEK